MLKKFFHSLYQQSHIHNQSDFDQVHSCFKTQLFESVPYDQLGQIKTDPQALDWHIDKILRLLDPHFIKKSSLKKLGAA